jgi:hypothetical protein
MKYLYFFIFTLYACTAAENDKHIIKEDSLERYVGVVSARGDDRYISIKIWENDSVYTRYTMKIKYDTLNEKYLNVHSMHIKTTNQSTKDVMQDINLLRDTTTIDSPRIGAPRIRTTYRHY